MQKLPGLIEIQNNATELALWDKLVDLLGNKKGILGYRFPSVGVIQNRDIPTFFIRSEEIGLIIIQVIDQKIKNVAEDDYWITSEDDEIYSPDIILTNFYQEVKNRLSKETALFDRKEEKLLIPIRRYILFYRNTKAEIESIETLSRNLVNEPIAINELDEKLVALISSKNFTISNELIDIIDSLLEGTDSYNKLKREKTIREPKTIQDYIKKSLEQTFKLDETQRSVAMQIPPGPQRIRGLAGTGKTIILCLKAALAHKMFPEFKILFVFNTQSMYTQIEKNIQDYYVRETKKVINPDKLEILHAWGGTKTKRGLYSSICDDLEIRPLTFFDVRRSTDSLDSIYSNLLQNHKSRLKPKYDLVLIDEAQDFTPSIFETIFYLTKGEGREKRIVWAYDEFQSLKDLKIREPEELFGKAQNGEANLENNILDGEYRGGIRKDFVLPNSYRNPRINLMVAHGIGLGLYTETLKLPMKDRKSWIARGYNVVAPTKKQVFKTGDELIIEREEKYSRNNLETLLKSSGKNEKYLIQLFEGDTFKDEINFVSKTIKRLLIEQGVEPEEIIVITLDIKNSENDLSQLRSSLNIYEIKCSTPGFVETPDKFKEQGRVTLTTTFRAKGNESNIVFVLHGEKVINDYSLRARNSFFVAVTRSRGWCYISSSAGKNTALKIEIDSILKDYPKFHFTFPDKKELENREKIISTSDSKIDQYELELTKRMQDDAYRALLLEKIANDPQLLSELQKKKK